MKLGLQILIAGQLNEFPFISWNKLQLEELSFAASIAAV